MLARADDTHARGDMNARAQLLRREKTVIATYMHASK